MDTAKYTLNDGTKIDLGNIEEVSEIKDYGMDEHTIDQSILCFSIRMKAGPTLKVSLNYHYEDWFSVMKELKKMRKDLLAKWELFKQTQS